MPEWLWWVIYILVCIWLQAFCPGVDFFLPGLLICLQQKKILWAVFLGLLCLMIQEGTGSLAFGSSLLWYAGLIIAFFTGKSLLESKNLIFIFGFACLAGIWHWIIIYLMCSLQNLQVMPETLFKDSWYTAVGMPFIWGIAWLIYNPLVAKADV